MTQLLLQLEVDEHAPCSLLGGLVRPRAAMGPAAIRDLPRRALDGGGRGALPLAPGARSQRHHAHNLLTHCVVNVIDDVSLF